MKWALLTELDDKDLLGRGAILRFPGVWPHEEVVDLMVFNSPDAGSGMGLIVASGYKAGLILVLLPKE